MAGIGFRLQALLTRGTYLEATSAYLSSAIIASGPWLTGTAALFVLSRTSSLYLPHSEHMLLLATITLSFASSLLVAGGPQLLITRYLADKLYNQDRSILGATSSGLLAFLIPLNLLALPFLLFAPLSLTFRLLTVTLFITQALTWLVMPFLSAAREFKRIVFIFLASYCISAAASYGLGILHGITGSLAGFTLGQVCALVFLQSAVYQEFPSSKFWNFAYLSYFLRYWDLFAIGLCYALSIWIDSGLFWVSTHAQIISGFFRLFPPYDISHFLVYLSTIPALALFMITLETNFYRHYQQYYQLIRCKGTLSELEQAKLGMISAVRTGFATILKVQSLIALFLCIIAQDITRFMGLSPAWVFLIRMQVLAGSAQFFVFMSMLFLLYIDRRRIALAYIALFATSNAGLTSLSIALGPQFYGSGYLLSALCCGPLGWFLLLSRLKKLEYLTFIRSSKL